MHNDPDRSWITDPDPDQPKGMHPKSLFVGGKGRHTCSQSSTMSQYKTSSHSYGVLSFLGSEEKKNSFLTYDKRKKDGWDWELDWLSRITDHEQMLLFS